MQHRGHDPDGDLSPHLNTQAEEEYNEEYAYDSRTKPTQGAGGGNKVNFVKKNEERLRKMQE